MSETLQEKTLVNVKALTIGGSTAYDLSGAPEFDAALARVVGRVNRSDVIVVANKEQRDRVSIELSRVGKLGLAQIVEVGIPRPGAFVRITAGKYSGRAGAVAGHVGRAVTYLLVPGVGLVNATEEQFEVSPQAGDELRSMGPPAVIDFV